nr:multiubiquitin domain-containing protein [Shewanella sp. UCD-FRSSP16_17]
MSFEDIVLLAFSHIKPGDNTIYTMTYKKAVGNKPEGTLVAGEVIKIKSGVIINVTATDKS